MQAEPSFPVELLAALKAAQRVVVLTGAGISAESGVPTFREAQTGLWARFRPEDLATPEAFRRDPRLVWEWYTWRRELVASAQPNPGHLALVAMENLYPDFTLITQNVDGLHARAGSRNLIELHGSLTQFKCFESGHPVDQWAETGSLPPRCPECGGQVRPDVVWFGESLPGEALAKSWQAAERCQVFFSVGTSGLVQPAAALPYTAKETGAVLVEINPAKTPLTSLADFAFHGPSGHVLPDLVASIRKEA